MEVDKFREVTEGHHFTGPTDNKTELLLPAEPGHQACQVDRLGCSGGIGVLWRKIGDFTIVNYSRNHVDLIVSDEEHGEWRCIGYYAFPEKHRRRDSWNFIRSLAAQSSLPWLCIGDYNDMLSTEDKKGRVIHPQWLLRGFREAIDDCNLTDIPLNGHQFTWKRSRGSDNFVEERIDQAMGTPTWAEKFPMARLRNLNAPVSGHSPILLETEVREIAAVHKKRLNPVRRCWNHGGKIVDGNFRAKIRKCKEQLEKLRDKHDEDSITEYKDINEQLAALLWQEEDYWRQRAKQYWLKDGDKNTRFFHTSASARKKTNKLNRLKDANGHWQEEQSKICEVAHDYFQNLFSADANSPYEVLDEVRPCVTDSQNEKLVMSFTTEEFKEAVFDMKPDKSPGPDGFNPAFFQRFWALIGTEVVSSCVGWLHDMNFPLTLNDTNVAMELMTPHRGLRQGEPLSPYLFIICTEGLSALIRNAERLGHIHGIKVCRGAPSISHLFFVDGSMLFFRANATEGKYVKNIIERHEKASGQAINLSKSGIMYSDNVPNNEMAVISDLLGVSTGLDTSRYIGLPSLIGRKKK
ncbi:uncharacterized protein LOC142544260 [Primulina tabacum]|uniref:uncharacterized protein LOC142544260 n=1 Tax=Primulina tabacum TaxID=48773 RepID=UPI003F5912B4